jgi:hypothetical protein
MQLYKGIESMLLSTTNPQLCDRKGVFVFSSLPTWTILKRKRYGRPPGTALHEETPANMNLSEMFSKDDPRTFEERRAEVVAIVQSAADFAGADYGLRGIFLAMSEADDEGSFNDAFDTLVSSLSENTTRYLQNV